MSDSPVRRPDSPDEPQEGRSVSSRTMFASYASFRSNATRNSRRHSSSPEPGEPIRRPQRTLASEPTVRHRPARNRPSFPIAKTWNGDIEQFPAYRRMIEGHLLQVGAGYLFEKRFLEKYQELGEAYFESDAFIYGYDLSPAQARYDTMYLYGMLLTTNRKNPLCPALLDPRYKDTQDGILCWQEFCQRYGYQGFPKHLVVDRLERNLTNTCDPTVTYTGFRSFLDEYESNVYLLFGIWVESDRLSDTYLKDRLVQCLLEVQPAIYLTQHVRDSPEMDFRESLRYLGQNSALCPWPNHP